MRSLLLISTSTVYGTAYLEHAFAELQDLLGHRKSVVFIPYALKDRDSYADRARAAFAQIGCSVDSLHESGSPRATLESAAAVFTGGGNTFRLLDHLYRLDLIATIRRRVSEGLLYAGASAGANVAGPTIRTTNDMPIVPPPSLEALGLVSFQLNPHYLDPDPASRHMGETREARIKEFHEENDTPVVGLREGSMLRVEGERVTLKGRAGARVFRKDREPVEVAPGASLEGLLC